MAAKAEQRLLSAVGGDGSDPNIALRSWQRNSAVDIGILLVTLWAMVVKLGAP